MNNSRIRMRHAYGQTPPNAFTDFDWIHRHQAELLKQYGECHIIVYHEQVIGVGNTYAAALQDAEEKLAPGSGEITPVHQEIWHYNPFLRARPTLK